MAIADNSEMVEIWRAPVRIVLALTFGSLLFKNFNKIRGSQLIRQ
jgi:hypothetical protein